MTRYFLPYSINLSPNVSIGEAFEHKLFGRIWNHKYQIPNNKCRRLGIKQNHWKLWFYWTFGFGIWVLSPTKLVPEFFNRGTFGDKLVICSLFFGICGLPRWIAQFIPRGSSALGHYQKFGSALFWIFSIQSHNSKLFSIFVTCRR